MFRPVSAVLLVSLLLLAACGTPPRTAGPAHPAAAPHATYKVGEPYQIDGVWYYPAEDLQL